MTKIRHISNIFRPCVYKLKKSLVSFLFNLLASAPNLSWADSSGDVKNYGYLYILFVIFIWWVCIKLTRKGGGWLLLGVLIAVSLLSQ